MQLATLNAEALAGLLAVDVGMADWLSGCTDGRRVIASTVLALLLLAAWRPVSRYCSAKSTADARLVRAWHMAAVIFFLGDAYFAFWNLMDCLGSGISDTGNPDWWPLVLVGIGLAVMWKSGVFDGEKPDGEESEGGGPESEE